MEFSLQTAVFGGGCFWCTEAVFSELKGVASVRPGYTGGSADNPTYEQVCSGSTGHVEVIKIDYDPAIISYEDLLGIFFATHDPTTPNRQGNDVGAQYRSSIFTTSDEQANIAQEFVAKLNTNNDFCAPVITEVKPLDTFYPAEEYHRDYYRRNAGQGYCQAIISPKVAKFRAKYGHLLKS